MIILLLLESFCAILGNILPILSKFGKGGFGKIWVILEIFSFFMIDRDNVNKLYDSATYGNILCNFGDILAILLIFGEVYISDLKKNLVILEISLHTLVV